MAHTSPRRILVTGGTGFTGSHLVRRLIQDGHSVIAVDVKRGLFDDELRRLGADIVYASVTQRALMEELVAWCDVVHHLAAAFRRIDLPQAAYWDINVNGTRYLLEAARDHGVERFVYCSTCGVHGNIVEPAAAEEAPIEPEDYYQYTKYEGERVAHEFIEQGVPVTILRPTAIYGPGDPGRWLMLFKRVAPGWFPMFGDGTTTYHPLYIDNLIDAFVLAMEREEAIGETYLIGDEQYYTLNEIVRAVGEALGVDVTIVHLPFGPLWMAAVLCEGVCTPLGLSPPLFRRRVDWFRQNRAFDVTKARQQLGYVPKIDLRTGLAKTARWYRENGYL